VEFLIGLVPIAVYVGVPATIILISSRIRRRSPKAGFVALVWAAGITIVASFASGSLSGTATTANGVFVVAGALLTAIVTARNGYQWGLSWLWLFLGPPGWWILMWARNNQLDRRRGEMAEIKPASAPAGPA
jgi:hypothetical protein